LEDWKLFENILDERDEGNTMHTKTVKVVGRSVSALAIGITLTAGSASLASASGHHDHGSKFGDVASGKVSSFDYANVGQGGYVTIVTPTSVTVQLWDGATKTYSLTGTQYTEGKLPSTWASLVVGDRVRVQTSSTDPTTATLINIELAELFGKVTAKTGLAITITDPQGFSRTILTSLTTTFTVGGVPGTLASVNVGSKIVAQGTIDANATTLDALSVEVGTSGTTGTTGTMNTIHGVVTSFTSGTVTVLQKDGTSTPFTLTTSTTFKDDGATLSSSDLATGSKVGIEASSTAPTTALNVEIELVHLAGNVTAVNGTTFTLGEHNGSTRTIVGGLTTTYTMAGAPVASTDVIVGSRIRGEGTLSTDGLTLTAVSVVIEHSAVPKPNNEGSNGRDHQGSNNGGRGSSRRGHNRR